MKGRRIVLAGVVGVSGLAGLGEASLTVASAGPAAHQYCGPAHRYIEAASATAKAHRVVVTGKRVTLVCGGDDDSHYEPGAALTLRVLKTATVKVWNAPADPTQGTRTVAATELPKWLKKNASEPVYKIHGPADGVTSLVEQWHP